MEEKVMNVNEEITIEEETEDAADIDFEENEVQTLFGEVVGCKKLNIRKSPAVNPKNIITIVPEGTMLMIIDPDKATKEWYKVELEDGTAGFCMKEFVSVNE